MNLLIDHLASVVIGVVVMLMLTAAQLRSSQTGVEQVVAHAAKTKALTLGEWLEDDILSLGANIESQNGRFQAPTSDSLGNTTDFTFYSDSLSAGGDTVRVVTQYKLVPTETVDVAGEQRQLYEMQREVTNVSPGEEDAIVFGSGGGTPPTVATLSFFRLDMLNRYGQTASDVDSAEYIRIYFAMVPEFDLEQNYLRELYWTTTLKVRPFWQET